MNIGAVSDFCRSMQQSVAFDDRLGLVLWEQPKNKMPILRALVRRLGADVMSYCSDTDQEVVRNIRRNALTSRTSVLLVRDEPIGELNALIRRLVCVGERTITAPSKFALDPKVVLMLSAQLYRSISTAHPVFKIGCVLSRTENEVH